jgi:regulator of sigma E protease
MSIIIALISLSFLIFIHELGHFMTAKAVGIKVLEFSLFMGPKLFSIKRGETEYSLRLIPMGGFVRMEGEEDSSEDPRAFSNQPPWKRALVAASGPVMNILLAFVFAIIFYIPKGFYTNEISEISENSPLKEAGVEVGDRLLSYDGRKVFDPVSDISIFMYGEDGSPKELVYYDVSLNKKVTKTIIPGKTTTRIRLGFTAKVIDDKGTNIIEMVEPNSPIEKAGIRRGDRIVKVDDAEVSTTQEIIEYLNVTRKDKLAPVDLTVERNGKILTFENITPFSDFQYTLGINVKHIKKGNVFDYVRTSFNYCISTIRNVIISFTWLFRGVVSFSELSGPVGIIGSFGTVVETREPVNAILLNLIYYCSFISINLGVMNLIPFPALDGGMLFILLIEKIRRKPFPQEKVGLISMLGFVLLIFVLIATLFNDIPRWIL